MVFRNGLRDTDGRRKGMVELGIGCHDMPRRASSSCRQAMSGIWSSRMFKKADTLKCDAYRSATAAAGAAATSFSVLLGARVPFRQVIIALSRNSVRWGRTGAAADAPLLACVACSSQQLRFCCIGRARPAVVLLRCCRFSVPWRQPNAMDN